MRYFFYGRMDREIRVYSTTGNKNIIIIKKQFNLTREVKNMLSTILTWGVQVAHKVAPAIIAKAASKFINKRVAAIK